MSEERLNSLLSLWQEQQLLGCEVPAAELCRACPELEEELTRRIAVLRRMNDLVEPRTLAGGSMPGMTEPNAGDGYDGRGKTAETLAPPDMTAPEGEMPAASVPGYEILGELGRGGMGVVYKARQLHLNRVVALKMILAGAHAGPDAIVRFLHEAETIARLKHPLVVQVHEFGTHEGKPFFSLEYMEGGSLADRLQGEPLTPAEAARLIETIAGAVQAAHEQGIIHRDLKPPNVLLTADGTPKITDFGLAKLGTSALTATGDVLGTPCYMAPEQAVGHAKGVGPGADIYALGAMLYELLTGKPPFKGGSAWETIQLAIGLEPVAPRQLQPRVPRDLETICLKCLQKEPSKRYASAAALADDLRRFREGEPIAARPVGTTERLWRWCRRKPVIASLTAALSLVVVGAIAGLTHLWLVADAERSAAVHERGRAEENAQAARQQQTQAEEKTRLAKAEADKATRIAQLLAGMFEASDPLGLGGTPILPFRSGETLTALKILDRGKDFVTSSLDQDPEVQAKLMDTLGGVYCTLGHTETAAPLLEKALAFRRAHLPPDDPDLASTLHNLGWLNHQDGDYARAEKYYREALQIRRQHERAYPIALTTTLITLAWLLTDMEDYAPAEALFKEAMQRRQQASGKDHRDVAVTRAGLAFVYFQQGRLDAAVAPTLECIGAVGKMQGNTRLSASVVSLMQGLLARDLAAVRLLGMGGPAEAERCLRKSLDLARGILHDNHPYHALVLHELARTLERDSKRQDEAEACYRKSLEIAKPYGLGHPKVQILLRSYCDLLRERGKRDEADKLLAQAAKHARERYGPSSPLLAGVLLTQALMLDRPGDAARKEQLLGDAVTIFRQAGPRPTRNRIESLFHLARCRAVSNPGEAETLTAEAINLSRKLWGSTTPFVPMLLCERARYRMNANRYVEGWLREAQKIALGPRQPADNTRRVWIGLERLYRNTGRSTQAVAAALEWRKLADRDPRELYSVALALMRSAALLSQATPDRGRVEDLAIETLRQARACGFANLAALRAEKVFDPLRGRSDYQTLFRSIEKSPGRVQGASP
jgi:tetratricopeptide (TPR) repeat protein/tRNA A-37 threonylcarbamoyl transferase component Bud32